VKRSGCRLGDESEIDSAVGGGGVLCYVCRRGCKSREQMMIGVICSQ
jgi:hypothetical protein